MVQYPLECIHAVFSDMMCTFNLDMHNTVATEDVADFITSSAWAICNSYHTVLGSMPGKAIFGRDFLFNIPYLAD